MEAWSRLTGQEPTPWEVSVLRRMDAAALNAIAGKTPQKSKPTPKRPEIMPDNWQALDRMLDQMG